MEQIVAGIDFYFAQKKDGNWWVWGQNLPGSLARARTFRRTFPRGASASTSILGPSRPGMKLPYY